MKNNAFRLLVKHSKRNILDLDKSLEKNDYNK